MLSGERRCFELNIENVELKTHQFFENFESRSGGDERIFTPELQIFAVLETSMKLAIGSISLKIFLCLSCVEFGNIGKFPV